MSKYVKKKWRRSGKFNKHHIKNKVDGGKSKPENLIVLDIERHKAFHFIFGNLDFLQAALVLQRAYRMKSRL